MAFSRKDTKKKAILTGDKEGKSLLMKSFEK